MGRGPRPGSPAESEGILDVKLFAFGLGYSAQYFVEHFGSAFDAIAGTVRCADKAEAHAREGIDTFVFAPDHDDPAIADRVTDADVLLISIPPGASVDPVLSRYGRTILRSPRRQTIVYLSTIGVYGDRQGGWVDETVTPAPSTHRSRTRLQAEKSWAAIGTEPNKKSHILRLAGIYGPSRNALVNLRRGTARRIVKKDQVFNRVHVEDVGRAIAAAITHPGRGRVWNVADDAPAPPQDVITYAALLMGITPPPVQDLADADLTPLARSFYAENKRASNRLMKETLGVELAYPTYRVGLDALWNAGEGRAESEAAAEQIAPVTADHEGSIPLHSERIDPN
jgi:nucleoside-diphosphate-sugar epimerase